MMQTSLYPTATEIDHDVEPGSAEWLNYMTGSKVGSVLGLSRFTSRMQLWEQMTGRVPHDYSPSRWAQHGTDREPLIRDAVAREWDTTIATPRMLVRSDEPRYAYSPDGIITERNALWECKAPANLDGWGAPLSAEIPPAYYAQVQWGMYVTGLTECHVTLEPHVGFIPQERSLYYVDADQDYITAMVTAVGDFLFYVDAGIPPLPPGTVTASTEDVDLIRRYAKNNAQRLEFERDLKADRKVIDAYAGEGVTALADESGEVLCRWSESVSTTEIVDWAAVESQLTVEQKQAVSVTRVDRSLLAEAVPDIVRNCTGTTERTTRRLLMGGAK